jgi:hypothetical protein
MPCFMADRRGALRVLCLWALLELSIRRVGATAHSFRLVIRCWRYGKCPTRLRSSIPLAAEIEIVVVGIRKEMRTATAPVQLTISTGLTP